MKRAKEEEDDEDEDFQIDDDDKQVQRKTELNLPKISLKFNKTTNDLDDYDPKNEVALQEYKKDGVVLDVVSAIFNQDYTFLPLKEDHLSRPLLVCHDGRIIFEAFSAVAYQAEDFLITIAEPVSRPSRIHEYKLTAYSLFAAVAVGMETNTIINVLDQFSKVRIPDEVVNMIRECTMTYGKAKLVLKHNRYFIESNYPETVRMLLKDPTIQKAHIPSTEVDTNTSLAQQLSAKESLKNTKQNHEDDDTFGAVITLDKEDDEDDDQQQAAANANSEGINKIKGDGESDYTSSFEINQDLVEDVRRRCKELDYPLMEEYDFRNDFSNASLDMDLSPKCLIRDYQEKCLSKMFGGGGGRARSGIIVLPTGAGKTLVGITAACTIKKNTLVLCTNAISVEQWANELKNWSSIKEGQIAKFTADNKNKFAGDSGIVISTYTMIAHTGKRAWDTTKMLNFINRTEWGLLILDEVHVVPANIFRRVLTTVAAHTKLGLTATLVREDDKIEDLNFLIGPKLYEANWMDLATRGHIAKVEATEIWCPMPSEYYKVYLQSKPSKRRLLCIMNPSKFMACQYLIDQREKAGDKIIVFSDNVFALIHYAETLGKPYIYGKTGQDERQKVLHYFRQGHPKFRTIFLSKVGDTSLDLPEATCLIQISSQFGSRRQEAQRMGRILRAKRRNEEGFKSRFFTLVSRDTDEVAFSAKRKRFLIDQGYEFKVVSSIFDLIPPAIQPTLQYSNKTRQMELLNLVLSVGDEQGEDEVVTAQWDDLASAFNKQALLKNGNKKKLGGAKGLTPEQKAKRDKAKEREKNRNPLFKAWKK